MSESGLPGRAGDFSALAEELRAFKAGPLSGRPSDRALAEAAGVSPSTIGDWLRGKRFRQDISRVPIMSATGNWRRRCSPGQGPSYLNLLAALRLTSAIQR